MQTTDVKIVNGTYRNIEIKDAVFPLVKEYKEGKNGNFVTVDGSAVTGFPDRSIRIKVVSKDENKISDLIKKLEPEDLIKYGLIPEFVGRMPIVTTLEDLDEKSLVKILKEPKNSLTKQYKRLFEFENVKLEFREDALAEIAKKAISKKTGARGLRSILETILLKTMFSLPDLENVDSVTVDKSVVKGKSDPILSYTKNKSTSAA